MSGADRPRPPVTEEAPTLFLLSAGHAAVDDRNDPIFLTGKVRVVGDGDHRAVMRGG